jgi:hypothetical protein
MLTGLENDYWIAVRPIWQEVEFKNTDNYLNCIATFSQIQIDLFAAHILYCEVMRGGFRQFYFNESGITVYEALKGFKAIGMPESAVLIQETIDLFEGKDLRDRDVRVLEYNDSADYRDAFFKLTAEKENGGFHTAANSYLHQNLEKLPPIIKEQIIKGENINRLQKIDNSGLDWEKLYETYSTKTGDENYFTQKITDLNIANLFEKFIGEKIIESAVNTFDSMPYGNLLAGQFIKKLSSDYCVDYVFQKFSAMEEPSTKMYLAGLLGQISNPRILKYFDQLLQYKKYKMDFGYILHNLLDDNMVSADEITAQIAKLKDYHPKAYNSLIEKIQQIKEDN